MRAALLLVAACSHPVPAPAPIAPAPPPPVVAVVVPVDAAPPDAAEPDAPLGEDYDDNAPKFPIDKITLGPLHMGMSEKDAVKVLGKPKSKGKAELMGATGAYQADWDYGDLDLQMSATGPKGPFVVTAISFSGTRSYKTPEGIGIGSTREELVAVYGKYIGHTNDKNNVLVGSMYFGMLFTLEDERVAGVFLGAMAF